MKALLALEDGRYFFGRAFGATGERTGEIVFNTSMIGYQEILTDPSYAGQIVVMTYPHIGNYGVNQADVESRRPFVEGFVVREYSAHFSNWRAEGSLDDYLKLHGIVGISEIDTRALVRHIRERGAMRACLTTLTEDPQQAIARARAAPRMVGLDLASTVTCDHPYVWNAEARTLDPGNPVPGHPPRFHVVAYDFGIKFNILRHLAARGCRITVVPAHTPAEDVFAMKPDGIFLSNGPGDPEPLTDIVATIRRFIGRLPIFGICLGHQLLGLAFGGRTYKLKFGHRGGNQPVKNLLTGRVEITSHNHGFAVAADSLPQDEIEITHYNLNDHTLEGMRHRKLPIFSVQYHPEAAPGPHDASYLFDEFIRLMASDENAFQNR
ncbi:MAG TPA: glutamine-hydrolyzing carbamoyl-phosphate synthase small subunit [Blastocatellia bacterium]|nr:glutamine-hydrolyzing carbamoyl-phosphate synthase small subunit [Blastocatellia bacterium]